MATVKTKTFLILAFTLAVWAIALSGVSSMQRVCEEANKAAAPLNLGGGALAGVDAFSAQVLHCGQVHR